MKYWMMNIYAHELFGTEFLISPHKSIIHIALRPNDHSSVYLFGSLHAICLACRTTKYATVRLPFY